MPTYGTLMRDGVNYSHDTAESISVTDGSSTYTAQQKIDDMASFIPIPTGGSNNTYLRDDLTWKTPPNNTCNVVSTAAAGLARKLTGATDTYLRGDGSWAIPDNDTYVVVTSAKEGLVPANGTSTKYLRENGSWATPDNNTYAVMSSGTTGLAPKGTAGKFLRGDATWQTPTNTTYPIVSTSKAGLVPTLTGSTVNYLRGDGAWATPTNNDDKVTIVYKSRLDAKQENRTAYAMLSYSANDTAETNNVRTGRLMVSMSDSTTDYMYAGDGNNTWWYIAANTLRINGKSWIQHVSSQQLDIKSDSVGTGYQNYGVQLGVYDGTWCFKGGENGYVGFGSPSHHWRTIYATNGTIDTSDRNQKENIIDLNSSAKDFIMDLKPVSYKFKNNDQTDNHDRTHYGLIAQDVEDTMTKMGMTALDFGGFCKDQKMEEYEVPDILENGVVNTDPDGNPLTVKRQRPIEGEYMYGLRYDEFIAPIIKTIQMRQQKLDEQEETIKLLESRIAQLENAN